MSRSEFRPTPEQTGQIANQLEGTCGSVQGALAFLDLPEFDPSEVEDALLDLPEGLERCKGCDWWMGTSSLDDEGYCLDQCSQESR